MNRHLVLLVRIKEESPGGQRLWQVFLEAHRSFAGLDASFHPLRMLVVVSMHPSTDMGESGVSQREIRVQGDSILEHVCRGLHILVGSATEEFSTSQVTIVRFRTRDGLARDSLLLLGR